jgi:hypothetical protein
LKASAEKRKLPREQGRDFGESIFMRKALILSLACVALATGAAFAQQARNADGTPAHSGRPGNSGPPSGASSSGGRGPAVPYRPLPRCPDLAVGAYAYVTAIPGADVLAADEIALQWSVSNGGNAPYVASNAAAQTLMLEYSSASGVQQVAAIPIPQQTDATGVTLGQGQSWRGYLRAQLTPEARRRTLRLRIAYPGDGRTLANDCDTGNNEVPLTRPPAG